TEVIEGGRINRVSVAVVVDGLYVKNDKGEITYQPRNKEEIDRIAALVRSAIGFDQKRGDQVEVANLRLAETPTIPISEPSGWMSLLQFTKDDIMHWIEVGVMSLLALLVLLLGVRPMIRRIMTPEGGALPPGVRPIIGPTGAVVGAVGPNGVVMPVGPGGVISSIAGSAGSTT